MARPRRAGRRTDYQWGNMGDLENGQDLGVTTSIFGGVGLQVTIPQTLMRIRGNVSVQLNATAVGERALVLVGLCIMSGDAFGVAGDSAAPEIFGTAASDEINWIWSSGLFISSLAEAAIQPDALSMSIDIDSKAMRKMKADDTLALVHQTPAELTSDQGGTYDMAWWVHALFGS